LNTFKGVYFELLENLSVWLVENAYNIALSGFFALIVLGFYRLISGQVKRLAREGRLDLNVSFLIRRVLRWGSYFIVAAFVFTQFGFKVDVVAGLVVVAGSTVIGFAAMSTLGNAVAGMIIMTSRPFSIGDRIVFGEEFVDNSRHRPDIHEDEDHGQRRRLCPQPDAPPDGDIRLR